MQTSVEDESVSSISASNDWRYWCRLCAKDDMNSGNIFNSNGKSIDNNTTVQAIWKYFSVHIKSEDDLPKLLCTDCDSLLTSLVHFNDRVLKVQKMYAALQYDGYSCHKDFNSIRMEYGVLKDDFVYFYMQQYDDNCLKENIDNSSISHMEYLEIKLENENLSDCIQPEEVTSACEEDAALAEDPFASDIDPALDDCHKFSEESSEADTKFMNLTDYELYNKIENSADLDEKESILREDMELELKRNKAKPSENSCSDEIEESTEESKGISGDKKYFCSYCSLQFQRPGSYDLHMKKRHGMVIEPFVCSQCPKSYKNRYDLNRHVKKHRPLSEKQIYPCPQCDKKFQKKYFVAKHIKYVHENIRSFICEECGEGLHTKAALDLHMLKHTDHAPFECELCKKGFKTRARLKTHIDTHSGTKYTCSKCGLQLNSRVTLSRHMLVHTDTVLHKCDYCGRGFKRSKALKVHLIVHSGLKPFSCKFCDKIFANSSNRRGHMKKEHPTELARAEELGEKTYTKNIPNIAVLKAVTQSAENLVPVACKQSGNFSLGRRPKLPLDSVIGIKNSNPTEEKMHNSQKNRKKRNSDNDNLSDGNIPSPFW